MKKHRIAPSILSADFSRLGEEIKAVEIAGADWIHLDVMDGSFVPNLTIGPDIVAAVRKITTLPLDVHLMVEKPENHIQAFRDAGADSISIHVEACNHLQRTLSQIRKIGAKSGIALNPATSIHSLENILDDLDMILIMTVNPGFGGQSFIPSSHQKLRALSAMLQKCSKTHIEIQVDGGITLENIDEVKKSGATVFVAGSAIFKSSDYAKTIRAMKESPLHG